MKEPVKYNVFIHTGVLLILISYALDMYFVISPVIKQVQAGALPAISVGSYFNFTVPIHPFLLLLVFLAVLLLSGIVASYAAKIKSRLIKMIFELPLLIPLAFALWIFTILIYGIFIKALYYQLGPNGLNIVLISPVISILLLVSGILFLIGSLTGLDYLVFQHHFKAKKKSDKKGVESRKREAGLLVVGVEGLVMVIASGYTQLNYLPYVGIVLIVASLFVYLTDPQLNKK